MVAVSSKFLLMAEIVDFGQDYLLEFSNGFILKSSNSSSYSVVFNSGICVTVEEYPDLLQSLIIVPEKYKGMFVSNIFFCQLRQLYPRFFSLADPTQNLYITSVPQPGTLAHL